MELWIRFTQNGNILFLDTIAPNRPVAENAALSIGKRRWQLVLLFSVLASLWLILCRHLSSEWALNEQYSYGWFVPFFAAYLFWLRWEDRPAAFRTSEFGFRICGVIAVSALLLLLPLRLFEIGNPDWRPLGWLHAAIVVGLTLFLIWTVGGAAWLKHFAFPVCFILVAVPWVSAIEMPVIQNLMRGVAAVAAETLNLFGIPAQLEGNLIRINGGLVGVNEACSGVRSLQTSLMIGLLFGELKKLPLVRRALLVAGAVAIALLANCLRALFLVWVATSRQVEAVTRWHDIAGYSIVLIVFVGTMILAGFACDEKEKVKRRKSEDELSLRGAGIKPFPTSYFLLPTFAHLAGRGGNRRGALVSRARTQSHRGEKLVGAIPGQCSGFSRNRNRRRRAPHLALRPRTPGLVDSFSKAGGK